MEKDMVRVAKKCLYCGATNLYRRVQKGWLPLFKMQTNFRLSYNIKNRKSSLTPLSTSVQDFIEKHKHEQSLRVFFKIYNHF